MLDFYTGTFKGFRYTVSTDGDQIVIRVPSLKKSFKISEREFRNLKVAANDVVDFLDKKHQED